MILVKFPNFELLSMHYSSDMLTSYRTWLNKHAGKGPTLSDIGNDNDWDWQRGDRYAQGVYIRDPEVATIFKLKFGL